MGNTGFLTNPDLKLILFGGKGGSGKTTSAAATALHLSKLHPKKRILVVSTDPAHSLGDSFDISIGNNVTPIAENIHALEIDAKELYDHYLKKNGEVIKEIADRGTLFDKEDIESFFIQSLPGLDEMMAIIRIADLLKAAEFDLIILDTAPTGHTMVLLSLPEQMEKLTDIMGMMMEKYHYMLKALTRRDKKDECDEFIAAQRKDVRAVRALLSNRATTEFVPVTIPEPMSIAEIEKAVQTLKGHHIPVNSIIINRVTEEKSECPFCSTRNRENEKYMREVEEKFARYNLAKMPLFSHEVRGIDDLTEYARILFGGAYQPTPSVGVKFEPRASSLPKGDLSDLLGRDELDFLIFGGKGGVGKTSIAAASAIYFARHNPEKKVLLFSTDPAHSLSDSFDQQIGNKITAAQGIPNLYALETDGIQLLEDFKRDYRDDIGDVFEQFLGKGMDIVFDREIMEKIIDVIPPGVDELMALQKIMDLRKEGEYDIYVMDSAASGHLIRFLQLPHLLRDWLKVIFRMLMKYRGSTGAKLNRPTERLLELSRDTRSILDTLSDSRKTEFVIISIPEKMGVAEMEDLSASISDLKISSSYAIINMIIPPTDCSFCAAKRENQQRYIEEIEARFTGQTIVPISLFPHDITGMEYLDQLGQTLFEGEEQRLLSIV
ncbi:MAG: ArsA family ATPase [Chloroflexi bacterium]|nr:ArsA family ATPase [Chloroflexota bacterium]